jgi:hypothetical protein
MIRRAYRFAIYRNKDGPQNTQNTRKKEKNEKLLYPSVSFCVFCGPLKKGG